jgi:hypothetical protein
VDTFTVADITFTHATQTLFAPYNSAVGPPAGDLLLANTISSFTIPVAHNPVAGTYYVSVKTGGAPNYVAAAVPLTIGGASDVTAVTSSTIAGAAATLTVTFSPPADAIIGTIVTVGFGAYGAGIVATPAAALVSGWATTTVSDVAYTAASSQLVFTIQSATAPITAVVMTVAVAANPEAGSRHFVTVETSLAAGVAASATSPIIISGTAPLAMTTSASPSTFDRCHPHRHRLRPVFVGARNHVRRDGRREHVHVPDVGVRHVAHMPRHRRRRPVWHHHVCRCHQRHCWPGRRLD